MHEIPLSYKLTMANLQVRDIDDKLYESLKRRAEIEHRSVSQEVVMIIEKHLQRDHLEMESQTMEFLKLSNSWGINEKQKRSQKIYVLRAPKTIGIKQSMSYLIDTDIIIYSLKEHERVRQNFLNRKNFSKSISVITYGELIYGAKKSQNREKNLATVYRIGELFPIIELTRGIIETFGELKTTLQKKGTAIEDFDLLIGSTALYLNYTLVSNNEKHFHKIPDLKIENWTK